MRGDLFKGCLGGGCLFAIGAILAIVLVGVSTDQLYEIKHPGVKLQLGISAGVIGGVGVVGMIFSCLFLDE
jgi:uncharacterized membrane protein